MSTGKVESAGEGSQLTGKKVDGAKERPSRQFFRHFGIHWVSAKEERRPFPIICSPSAYSTSSLSNSIWNISSIIPPLLGVDYLSIDVVRGYWMFVDVENSVAITVSLARWTLTDAVRYRAAIN